MQVKPLSKSSIAKAGYAILLVAAALSVTPAAAQDFFGWRHRGYTYYEPAPVFAPPPYAVRDPYGPRGPQRALDGLSARQVEAMLARRGLQMVRPVQRNGKVYLADVRTRNGAPARLVIDGYYGEILQRFPGAHPPRPPAPMGREARAPDSTDRGLALPPGAPRVITGIEPPPALRNVNPAPARAGQKQRPKKKVAARPAPALRAPVQPPIAPPVATAPPPPAVSAPAVSPPAQTALPPVAARPAEPIAPPVIAPPAVSPRADPARAGASALPSEPAQTVEPLDKPVAKAAVPAAVPAPPPAARVAPEPLAAPPVAALPPARREQTAPSADPKRTGIDLPPAAPVILPDSGKREEASSRRIRNPRVIYPGGNGGAPAPEATPAKPGQPVPVAPLF